MYTHALPRFTILLHIRLLFLGTLRFLVIWDVEIFIHHYRSMKISTEPHDQSLVLQKEDLSPACQVITAFKLKQAKQEGSRQEVVLLRKRCESIVLKEKQNTLKALSNSYL